MTPYITPELLQTADTGIDWSSLVPGHTGDAVALAEQTRICWVATSMADTYCNQTLRATLDTEEVYAPDDRAPILPSGVCRIQLSRWPVIAVAQVQYWLLSTPNPTPQTIPPGNYRVRNASPDIASAAGAFAIDILPGYITWLGGRGGYVVQVQYTNGWPHSGLTANVSAGATNLPVDDCTGMQNGTVLTLVDGGSTEQVTVASASAVTGPGTLTLQSPTVFAHAAGVMATALPAVVMQSCVDFAVYVAMTRGVSSVQIPPMHGVEGTGVKGGPDMALLDEAYARLSPFRRVL